MKNTTKKVGNKRGFTLLELIVVLVILAIIAAIAVPTAFGSMESARNTTDAYNARVMARTVQLYLAMNQDDMQIFVDTYGANPGAYRPYILVTDSMIAVSSDSTGIIQKALQESGVLGKELYANRYNGVLCQSKKEWPAYSIGFTVLNGRVVVGYCGITDVRMVSRRWTVWSGTDPTSFREHCVGTP